MTTVPSWVRRKLDVTGMPLESFAGMTLDQVCTALNIKDKRSNIARWIVKYHGVDLDEKKYSEVIPGVKLWEVNRNKGLVGTWRHFGASDRSGFDALGITDEAVAEYIASNRVGAVPKTDKKKQAALRADMDVQLDERYKEYLNQFESDTPNDKAMLRNLASMEVRLEAIQSELMDTVGTVDAIQIRKSETLNKQSVDLSKEIRELQKALGIDKVSRDNSDKADPLGVLRDAMRDAKWLLDNEIHTVEHHCPDGKVVPIMQIWHFFPTHPHTDFKQVCPNCGMEIVVSYKYRGVAVNSKDFVVEGLDG